MTGHSDQPPVPCAAARRVWRRVADDPAPANCEAMDAWNRKEQR